MINQNKKTNQQVIVSLIGIVAILIIILTTVYRAKNSNNEGDTKPKSTEEALAYALLTGPELMEKTKNDSVQIIDIRTISEFGLEHIVDSKNIPITELSEDAIVDQAKDIVIIGTSSEQDIKKASDLLSKKTSGKIFVLLGGFVDWKSIGGTTVTWGDPTSFTDQSKVSFISMEEFKEIIASKNDFILVDARKNIPYQEGHISGAINVPVSEIEKRRNEFDTTKEIIIYADDELEAFQEAVKLFDMKLISSKVLRGGLNEWKSLNYALVK